MYIVLPCLTFYFHVSKKSPVQYMYSAPQSSPMCVLFLPCKSYYYIYHKSEHFNSLPTVKFTTSFTVKTTLYYCITPCVSWLTSSWVSTESSTFGLALRARRGAIMLESATVLVGGGPPRGWPRITTASPDRTCIHNTCMSDMHMYMYMYIMNMSPFQEIAVPEPDGLSTLCYTTLMKPNRLQQLLHEFVYLAHVCTSPGMREHTKKACGTTKKF